MDEFTVLTISDLIKISYVQSTCLVKWKWDPQFFRAKSSSEKTKTQTSHYVYELIQHVQACLLVRSQWNGMRLFSRDEFKDEISVELDWCVRQNYP